MTEKRKITKDDIWLKARLLSEGARLQFRQAMNKGPGAVILDGCELPVTTPHNKYSSLEVVFDKGHVTISDQGKVLGTGSAPTRRSHDEREYKKASSAAGSDLLAISVHFRCHNHDSGKGCMYCEKTIGNKQVPSGQALSDAIAKSTATAIQAVSQGWRGCLMMTGGVLPPWRRDRLIDRLEAVMEQLHESLDDDVLSQLQITPNVYPPNDLSELDKWKQLGINATSFDLEVMDPAFWRAICPGKAEATTHEHWIEASEASAEIFGRGRGAMAAVVLGVEPMSTFVKGFEDLVSRGVFPTPYFFLPPRRKLGFHGFRPPTADWLVEVTEEMADILFHYADTFDVNLLMDDRPGLTRVGRSFNNILVCDEVTRRLQEMGRIPPGLPRSDVYEPTRFTEQEEQSG